MRRDVRVAAKGATARADEMLALGREGLDKALALGRERLARKDKALALGREGLDKVLALASEGLALADKFLALRREGLARTDEMLALVKGPALRYANHGLLGVHMPWDRKDDGCRR